MFSLRHVEEERAKLHRTDLLTLSCSLIIGDLEPVNEGDNVLVTATPAELEELHKRRGLWQPVMAKVSISLFHFGHF